MTAKDVANEVLSRIKKEHIAPKPKWQFLLKKSVLWGIFVVTLLFGGLAMSLIILMITTNDWDIFEQANSTFGEYFFMTLPYFWLLLFAVFLGVSFYNFKHTTGGYKLDYVYIVIINLMATILLGFAFLGMGWARHVENLAAETVPFYEEMARLPRFKVWMNPEQGLVAGKIKEMGVDDLILVDIDNKEWVIITSDLPDPMYKQLDYNKLIGVKGVPIDDITIRAEGIKVLQQGLRMLPDPNKPQMMKEKMIMQRSN